jgi:2-polyprenyl-3-methyl-5-hydroxy-6-metoxy-1,4-benzoquinol methylase
VFNKKTDAHLAAIFKRLAEIDTHQKERIDELSRKIEAMTLLLGKISDEVNKRLAEIDTHQKDRIDELSRKIEAMTLLLGKRSGEVDDGSSKDSFLLTNGKFASPSSKRLELGSTFDPSTHYCEEYYGGGAGLEHYHPHLGWIIYHGPGHVWHGFVEVAASMLNVVGDLSHSKILDIGCSYGDFVERAVNLGLNAYGVDLSESAISKSSKSISARLICSDITQPSVALHNLAPFGVTTSWDFWEHIFEDDLETLLKGVHDLTLANGLMINCICTCENETQEQSFPKGIKFDERNSWLLCSGHVNLRTKSWWLNKFSSNGFKPREDLAQKMHQSLLANLPDLPASWSLNNIVIVEKS